MEIDSAIFQDLESVGNKSLFKMAMEKSGILFGEILKYPEMDITLCCIKHLC